MSQSPLQVKHVAALAGLRLTEQELEEQTVQLDRILKYVDRLRDLDGTCADAATAGLSDRAAPLRPDRVREPDPDTVAPLMGQAPRVRDGYLVYDGERVEGPHPAPRSAFRAPRSELPAPCSLTAPDARTLAAMIRRREASAEEVTRAHLDRAEALSWLGAYLTLDRKGALAAARRVDARLDRGEDPGPLAGLPVALKDSLVTRGLVTTAGSRTLEGWIPSHDGAAVARLRRAGAVILGKTNMDELSMGSSCERSAFFGCRNPRDPGRVPGGSSGGSAAAVAAHLCVVALGSDTGGSVRQPAALCGVVGLKPTYGVVSRRGLIAFASSLDQIGPLGRTVADCELLLEVVAGHDPGDSTSLPGRLPPTTESPVELDGLRVGVPTDPLFRQTEAHTAAAVAGALAILERAGARLVPVTLPHGRLAVAAYHLIATSEASANLARYDGLRYGHRRRFGPEVKRRIMLGTFALSEGYRDAYYARAQAARALICRDLEVALEACDVIATPTTPGPAFPLGERMDDALEMYLCDLFTTSCNLAGLPGISLPCGEVPPGLPVGLQLLGPAGEDRRLLAVAAAVERGMRNAERGGVGRTVVGETVQGRRARIPEHSYLENETLSVEHEAAPANDQPLRVPSSELRYPVIGLEVHVQLATASKIFCACPARYGAPPNSLICPVCTGQPGALPVLNQGAVEMATRLALALGARVRARSIFARKSYVYPDLPKGYQISQYEEPLAEGGAVQMWMDGRPHQVPLTRLHLEEDAGKSVHRRGVTLVDLNRAGVPLVELVTEPCIRSPREAAELLRTLRGVVRALGISDGHMEQGSLRCDANLSLRRGDGQPGTRVEVKNLNSFRFVQRALEHEQARQGQVLDGGGVVKAETRLWDQERGVTAPMRSKEEAGDYRYFPEPDLPPLRLDGAWIERCGESLPELPAARRGRLMELGLRHDAAADLTRTVEPADYFEDAVAAGAAPVDAANWILTDVLARVTDPRQVASAPVPASTLAALLDLVQADRVSNTAARKVWARLWGGDPRPPLRIAEAEDLLLQRDPDALAAAVDQVLTAHPDEVEQYRAGKTKLLSFFVGQVMKATKGKADPKLVKKYLGTVLGF